jgi:hypothetical protein
VFERAGLSYLFSRNENAASFRSVLFWWETRRIHYNLILLVVGLCGAFIYLHLFDLYAPDTADDGLETGLSVVAFVVAANACYTIGWIAEGLLLASTRKRGLPFAGQLLFSIGLAFSVLVTLIPATSGILNTIAMMRAHQSHWL